MVCGLWPGKNGLSCGKNAIQWRLHTTTARHSTPRHDNTVNDWSDGYYRYVLILIPWPSFLLWSSSHLKESIAGPGDRQDSHMHRGDQCHWQWPSGREPWWSGVDGHCAVDGHTIRSGRTRFPAPTPCSSPVSTPVHHRRVTRTSLMQCNVAAM